jgi:hypothetical protein
MTRTLTWTPELVSEIEKTCQKVHQKFPTAGMELDDLLSKVMEKVWSNFDPTRSSLSQFVGRASQCLLLDHKRDQSRRPGMEDLDSHQDTLTFDETFDGLLLSDVVFWLRWTLPEDELKCLEMLSDGYTTREIGEHFGKSQKWPCQVRDRVRLSLINLGLTPSWYDPNQKPHTPNELHLRSLKPNPNGGLEDKRWMMVPDDPILTPEELAKRPRKRGGVK